MASPIRSKAHGGAENRPLGLPSIVLLFLGRGRGISSISTFPSPLPSLRHGAAPDPRLSPGPPHASSTLWGKTRHRAGGISRSSAPTASARPPQFRSAGSPHRVGGRTGLPGWRPQTGTTGPPRSPGSSGAFFPGRAAPEHGPRFPGDPHRSLGLQRSPPEGPPAQSQPSRAHSVAAAILFLGSAGPPRGLGV
ncbi:hypothetical protein NDU88_004525 [Pleurodeles waltl]|uniref:Uncharacterized protein n=1 Tax=Pleurodeles waltl TaxID=8319 RepID=A0AAV7RLT7_PLEWA|nr:hypothetical protein NDU88_004525 [Pleurodeles waltl]